MDDAGTTAVHNAAFGLTVTLPGQVSDGAVLSVTTTLNEQLAVLPAASVIVYVTVDVPTLNILVPTVLIPDAGELAAGPAPVMAQVWVTIPQLSNVLGLGTTTEAEQLVLPAPVVALTVAGQVIEGAVLSVTTIVCTQVAVLPAASVAV